MMPKLALFQVTCYLLGVMKLHRDAQSVLESGGIETSTSCSFTMHHNGELT